MVKELNHYDIFRKLHSRYNAYVQNIPGTKLRYMENNMKPSFCETSDHFPVHLRLGILVPLQN